MRSIDRLGVERARDRVVNDARRIGFVDIQRIASDPCCSNFRVRFGNPELIEHVLIRRPKLRVNMMHAGWPYLQETIALMDNYPQVYVDVGSCGWALPRGEYYAYLGAIVRAGLSKRVMFGSDHMFWPDLIGVSVEAIDSAPFLSAVVRRDIFHDNAARFYKL